MKLTEESFIEYYLETSRKCRIQGMCFASERSENGGRGKLIRLQIYSVKARASFNQRLLPEMLLS